MTSSNGLGQRRKSLGTNAVSLDLAIDGCRAEAEDAGSLDDIPLSHLQRVKNGLTFDVIHLFRLCEVDDR